MWSPDLSNVSSVELIAAMPLAVTTAAFVFSKAAIFAASTCIVWIACLAAIHDLNEVLSFQWYDPLHANVCTDDVFAWTHIMIGCVIAARIFDFVITPRRISIKNICS